MSCRPGPFRIWVALSGSQCTLQVSHELLASLEHQSHPKSFTPWSNHFPNPALPGLPRVSPYLRGKCLVGSIWFCPRLGPRVQDGQCIAALMLVACGAFAGRASWESVHCPCCFPPKFNNWGACTRGSKGRERLLHNAFPLWALASTLLPLDI